MNDRVFIATTGSGLARASRHADGRWEVERLLPGSDIRCLAADPLHRDRPIAGTQGQGVLRSDDRGRTWRPVGLAVKTVKAIAASPTRAGVVFAGAKPAAMFVSDDGGVSWAELVAFRRIPGRWFWWSPAERPHRAYVQSIALSPTDPARVVVGIEAGATVVSVNGGASWTGHRRGALRDCHTLTFHATHGAWAYAGGGGVGAWATAPTQRSVHPGRGGDPVRPQCEEFLVNRLSRKRDSLRLTPTPEAWGWTREAG